MVNLKRAPSVVSFATDEIHETHGVLDMSRMGIKSHGYHYHGCGKGS